MRRKSAGITTEQWIQEAISQKLQDQTNPTDSEERGLILLAQIFKTYKSPPNTKLEFDEAGNSLLKDLEARGFVDSAQKELREYDRYLYREPHLVECFSNKIKYYRHIFSRFDKLAHAYLGFLSFVAALIWLR